VSRDLGVGGKK